MAESGLIKTGDCVWFASFYEASERGEKKQANGSITRVDWPNKQVCVLHEHQDGSSEVTWLELSDLWGNWNTGYNCWMLWNY